MGVVDDVRKVTQDMILPEFRALVVRVENLEKQIAELRGDVKEQIGQLRGDVKGQIDGVRGEMKAQIAELQGDVK